MAPAHLHNKNTILPLSFQVWFSSVFSTSTRVIVKLCVWRWRRHFSYHTPSIRLTAHDFQWFMNRIKTGFFVTTKKNCKKIITKIWTSIFSISFNQNWIVFGLSSTPHKMCRVPMHKRRSPNLNAHFESRFSFSYCGFVQYVYFALFRCFCAHLIFYLGVVTFYS